MSNALFVRFGAATGLYIREDVLTIRNSFE